MKTHSDPPSDSHRLASPNGSFRSVFYKNIRSSIAGHRRDQGHCIPTVAAINTGIVASA